MTKINVVNPEEQAYLDMMKDIMDNGNLKSDRTGVGTKSKFGTNLSWDLSNGKIPITTSRKTFYRNVFLEELFFIAGKSQTKELEAQGCNLWKYNTSREFLDKRGLFDLPEGSMGKMYGRAYRDFNGVDQLKNALNLIKTDPDSRRITVTAHDPSVSNQAVLDTCHNFFQFYVHNGILDCQWYSRSADFYLGLNSNVINYSLITHLFAKAANLKTGKLYFCGGDCHVYLNHFDQVKEQYSRSTFEYPTLKIDAEINSIEDMEKLSVDQLIVENYKHHSAIKAPMAI